MDNIKNILADKNLQEEIKQKTHFLDKIFSGKIPLRQRLWHVEKDIYLVPSCEMCDNIVNWSVRNKSYRRYCSSKCSGRSDSVTALRKSTCLEKYGHTTNLKSDNTKDKIKATNLQKYGVENPFLSEAIQQKIKATNLERYGEENASKNIDVIEKINKTHSERYDRKRQSQSHISEEIINLKNNKELMEKWHTEYKMPITEIADTLHVNHSQLCIHFKENLGINIQRHNISVMENEIADYIRSLRVTVIQSDRSVITPKELDIYIPELNMAFEVDGLYWHTELKGKNRDYHLAKTEQCAEKGIRLVHIFSNEWETKQEIVKSRIASLLHKNDRIFARKTIVKIMFPNEIRKFFSENHIQGNAQSSFGIGLIHDGQIVSAMSFGKSRFNKTIEWELIRYANKLNTNVVGGASKLFKYFTELYQPESIVSYSDRRWNTGNLYKQLGFSHTHSSGPNYFYTKDFLHLDARVKFQKHKLKDLLEHFDPDQTEWQNMTNNGYDRIWDCGNDVFHWHS